MKQEQELMGMFITVAQVIIIWIICCYLWLLKLMFWPVVWLRTRRSRFYNNNNQKHYTSPRWRLETMWFCEADLILKCIQSRCIIDLANTPVSLQMQRVSDPHKSFMNRNKPHHRSATDSRRLRQQHACQNVLSESRRTRNEQDCQY